MLQNNYFFCQISGYKHIRLFVILSRITMMKETTTSPVEKQNPDMLFLLPMPLGREQLLKKKQVLQEKRKEFTIEQIALQEVAVIISWRTMPESAVKRLYRNLELIYTTEELNNLLLATWKIVLTE